MAKGEKGFASARGVLRNQMGCLFYMDEDMIECYTDSLKVIKAIEDRQSTVYNLALVRRIKQMLK
ncbi:hypothetical protein Gohar_011408 [Gossypium harknessii]|uniref:Uncharacterized protein n=1 Tax=Gossypium harknessii TaxID=34285 RepID=A0A7J9GW56_9ROSI|nr:hypothetical protein [Gossypium harknessii]